MIFRLRFGRPGFWPVYLNLFAGARGMGPLGRLAIDKDMALFDQALHRTARDGGKFFTQIRIEPHPGLRLFDRKIFGAGGHQKTWL